MATLYEDFGLTESTANLTDNLLAGDLKRVEMPIVIASGQGALVRGTLLGKITTGGKYAIYDNAAVDGTGVVAGVLAVDTDAATGGDVAAFMYVTGEFNIAAITGFGDATSKAAAIVDAAALNIYFKTVAV